MCVGTITYIHTSTITLPLQCISSFKRSNNIYVPSPFRVSLDCSERLGTKIFVMFGDQQHMTTPKHALFPPSCFNYNTNNNKKYYDKFQLQPQ